MKKYALIGTSCVGKTTTLYALETKLKEKKGTKVAVVPEAARAYFASLEKIDDPLAFEHNIGIQDMAMKQEQAARDAYDIIISDRSVVDPIMYAHSANDDEGAAVLLARVRDWLSTYDHFFLLDPVDVPYVRDEIRRESEEARNHYHNMYMKHLPDLNVPWTLVSGTVEERVNKILQSITSSAS